MLQDTMPADKSKLSILHTKKMGIVFLIIIFIIALLISAWLYSQFSLYFQQPTTPDISYDSITTKEVIVDDLKIYYKTAGNIHNPPLVLIHGTGGSYELGEHLNNKLINELSKQFYIVAPELPGYKRSEPPKQEVSSEYFVKFVHTFIKQLDVSNYILVGQSSGGKIVTIYATQYSDEIKLLVIADSAPAIKDRPVKYKFARSFGSVIQYIYQSTLVPDKFKHFTTRYFLSRPDGQIDSSNYQQYAVMAGLYKNNDTDYTDEIKNNITAPTIIIWGENDKELPLTGAYKLEKLIKGSEVFVFDAGHTAMHTFPDKTREIISAQLKAQN